MHPITRLFSYIPCVYTCRRHACNTLRATSTATTDKINGRSAGTTAAGVGSGEPRAAGARLALAVEEHGGDGRAEVVAPGEATGVEVVSPRRREHRLPTELPE